MPVAPLSFIMNDQDSSAGRIALEWARKGMRAYERERNGWEDGRPTIIAETETLRYIQQTPEEKARQSPVVDGIVEVRGVNQDTGVFIVTAALECRARFDLTEEQLVNEYDSRLMLDSSKLEGGHRIARLLNAEFWMLQVFTLENFYYVSKLTDRYGNYLSDWDEKETSCPKTINSSERVIKPVIYVDIAKSHKYYI